MEHRPLLALAIAFCACGGGLVRSSADASMTTDAESFESGGTGGADASAGDAMGVDAPALLVGPDAGVGPDACVEFPNYDSGLTCVSYSAGMNDCCQDWPLGVSCIAGHCMPNHQQ